MRWCLLGFLLLGWFGSPEAARILAMLPFGAHSHFAVSESVLVALADKGHEITLYSPITPKPNPRIKHFELQTNHSQQFKVSGVMTFDEFIQFIDGQNYFGLWGPQMFWYSTVSLCEEVLEHPKIKTLMSSDQQFDLMIGESFFGQESMLIFAHRFGVPSVSIDTFGIWSIVNRKIGNELQISHVPERISLGLTHKMTFMERFRNTVSVIATLLSFHYVHLPSHQQLLDKKLGDKAPKIYDLVDNVSLALVNWHPSLVSATAPPSLVPIGGIHIKDKIDPLPQDIKEFMESGPVVYFSLGSVIPVETMPPDLIQVFVRVFAKLPHKVLWKTSAKDIPNLPANVKIAKWIPQLSVLAHPNCKLFITHGGLLSQLETFNKGVPIIGIPIFGDQLYNVRVYETLGVGRMLKFADISEDTMTKMILDITGQPRYTAAAKRISQLYHHRLTSPADSVAFWVEHVLRYGGAHLSPESKRLSFIQVQLLDVWATMLAVVLSLVLLLRFIFVWVCCRKKQHSDSTSSQKKKN